MSWSAPGGRKGFADESTLHTLSPPVPHCPRLVTSVECTEVKIGSMVAFDRLTRDETVPQNRVAVVEQVETRE